MFGREQGQCTDADAVKDAPQAELPGTPMAEVNDEYPVINVEKRKGQPDSVHRITENLSHCAKI